MPGGDWLATVAPRPVLMLVRMLQTIVDGFGVLNAGQVVSVSEATGLAMVNGGLAERVDRVNLPEGIAHATPFYETATSAKHELRT